MMESVNIERLAQLIAAELVARTRGNGVAPTEPPDGPSRADEIATEAADGSAGEDRPGLDGMEPGTTHLDASARRIPIGVAAHELVLSEGDWRTLFGAVGPTTDRPLRQPGQVIYRETVRVIGPAGELSGVAVTGPFRERSRLALARSEARRIGLAPPVCGPLELREDVAVTVVGPVGSVVVPTVVPAAHVYLDPASAERFGLSHGRRVHVRCAGAGRAITLHDVPVFVGGEFAVELRIEVDEANAAGVGDGDVASILDPTTPNAAGPPPRTRRRPLLTERDLDDVAARGEVLSPESPYLITPAARDRARSLGIWREG